MIEWFKAQPRWKKFCICAAVLIVIGVLMSMGTNPAAMVERHG